MSRLEIARLLVVDHRADQVGRQQVGSELDALEAGSDGLGDSADRHRLGEARHAFEQDVAAGEQPDQDTLYHVFLADDAPRDLIQYRVGELPARRADDGVGGLLLGGALLPLLLFQLDFVRHH